MRILIAHSRYRLAGGEDRYVAQQEELLKRAHTVRLETRENSELDVDPHTAARMIYTAGERRAFDRAIAEFNPDVIHLHNPYPSLGPAVHLAAEKARIPLVQTVHNLRLRCPNGLMYTEGAPCQRCLGGRYDNAVRHDCFPSRTQAVAYASALWIHRFGMGLDQKVTSFIAPSQFVRQRLIEWGFPSERIMMVRNFTEAPKDVAPIGDHGLYLGRLSAEKGVDVLLGALAHLGDPEFEISGDGPDRGRLRAMADKLGLRRVRFTGFIPAQDVPLAIDRARYAVLPSTWDENAPLAALEAMGRARPIVATAVGGLRELAEEGRGRLCPPGDVAALAGAMAGYDDAAVARADGRRARRFVMDECSPEAHLRGLTDAYASIAPVSAETRRLTVAPSRRNYAVGVSRETPGITEPGRRGPSVGRPDPHVLMVHCYYRDLGGENLSFEAETRLLQESGIRVTTYTRDNRELDRVGALGRIQVGLRTVWAEDAYRELIDIVRRERPDVVHFQNTFPLISPSAIQAVHRLRVPVVQALRNYRLMCASAVLFRDGHVCTDCVGRTIPWPAIQHGCYHGSRPRTVAVASMQVAHRVLRTWSDAVQIYIAPSEFARDLFVNAGMDPARVVVKPNFVAPDPGMRPSAGDGALFAGRLAPEKGVLTLVRAWRELPDVRLRIVGDGPLRRELERFIARERLDDRVELLGHQPPERVLELMGESRCLIFPSEWYETFGRVAVEAFACGVPVVASRLGAMAEVVTDAVTGRLFEPGDPHALAAAVNLVMKGEDHETLRHNARAVFERRFAPEANLDLLLRIYEQAIASRRKPAVAHAATGGA